jgi:hypothetical protein
MDAVIQINVNLPGASGCLGRITQRQIAWNFVFRWQTYILLDCFAFGFKRNARYAKYSLKLIQNCYTYLQVMALRDLP